MCRALNPVCVVNMCEMASALPHSSSHALGRVSSHPPGLSLRLDWECSTFSKFDTKFKVPLNHSVVSMVQAGVGTLLWGVFTSYCVTHPKRTGSSRSLFAFLDHNTTPGIPKSCTQ